MRPLMTKEEIEALIAAIPSLLPLTVPVEKQRREIYRTVIGELRPEGYVQVIKTVRRRRAELTAAHKHVPMTDLEYGRLARSLLAGECAHVLGLTLAQADAYLAEYLENDA